MKFFHSRKVTATLIASGCSVIFSVFAIFNLFSPAREALTDLLFTEKSADGEIIIVQIDDESVGIIGQWPWPRAAFASLLERIRGASVAGIDINFKEPSRLGAKDDEMLTNAIRQAPYPIVLAAELLPDGSLHTAHEQLSKYTQSGFTNLLIDASGIVRRFRPRDAEALSFARLISELHSETFPSKIPAVLPEALRIHYLGRPETFPAFSFADVLKGKIPAQFFKNKIVLVGATAPDLQDYKITPFGPMSGVEIQASAAATLLKGKIYRSYKFLTYLGILLLSLAGTTLSFHIHKVAPLVGAIGCVFIFYNVLAFLSFDRYLILDLFYPNLALGLTTALSITTEYVRTAREKRFIRESFNRYLAPQIIEELLKNPEQLKLGGEIQTLTILFSDIRGFTSLSEKMSPQELTSFLNLYLTLMTEIILEQHGLIDKYIGDAIMAFWGAPLPNERHAEDAVTAALLMMKKLEAFNALNQGRGQPKIDIGIGIHTGEVTVGNMGSENRFDYTVIGDTVNLASRLEGLNKVYGTNIIISGRTVEAVKKDRNIASSLREIDRVRVKGKKEAITIYEAVPYHNRNNCEKIKSFFNEGLELYYRGDFERAAAKFKEALVSVPDDGPTKVLYERTRDQRPAAEWDGVYTLTSK